MQILGNYSFFFATKERIPLKLTMECIDSDELKDNKIDKNFLEKRSETINDTEFDSNNNMMGMASDEKRK